MVDRQIKKKTYLSQKLQKGGAVVVLHPCKIYGILSIQNHTHNSKSYPQFKSRPYKIPIYKIPIKFSFKTVETTKQYLILSSVWLCFSNKQCVSITMYQYCLLRVVFSQMLPNRYSSLKWKAVETMKASMTQLQFQALNTSEICKMSLTLPQNLKKVCSSLTWWCVFEEMVLVASGSQTTISASEPGAITPFWG